VTAFDRVSVEEVYMDDPAYEATVYQNKEAWKENRDVIGASEAAAALRLSPYQSEYALWSQKVGLSSGGPETRAMRRGVVMEPFVADEYAREHGAKLTDLGRWTICRSRRFPHLSCTPDRLIEPVDDRGPGVLEIKSVTNRDAWARGTVPEHYRIQVVASLAVLGLRWGVLAGYVAGTDEIIPVTIERDEDQIATLVDGTADFWALVEDGRAALARGEQPTRFPDPDASEATMEALRQRYRVEIAQDEVPTVDTSEARDIEAEWAQAAAIYGEASKRLDAVKVRAMALMAERPEVRLPGGTRLTWKTVARKAHAVEASARRELRRYAAK
jgi:putative phage-type endonuclease